MIGREFGYGGEPRAALLLVDWDGDAAVGIPAAAGGVDFKRVEKLRYRDGGVLRMCGVSGQWGRTAMTVADWDGDGRWDILAGSPNGCNAFIMGRKIPTKATVFFLRNTGNNAAPVFERPEPLAGADGALLNFGVHNATPCPADLDGDGRPDLLVGSRRRQGVLFQTRSTERLNLMTMAAIIGSYRFRSAVPVRRKGVLNHVPVR